MEFPALHPWKLSAAEAVALQKQLAKRIDTRKSLGTEHHIAGADVSYNRFSSSFYAGVVVLRADDCTVVETQEAIGESRFPYIPGLLSFRELPVLLKAFAKLERRPDVVLYDGQGIAHPRRIGIAAHLGLWLGVPTVGCAKTRLCGEAEEPGNEAGARTPLTDKEEVIGSVVRTKRNVKPLYVSSGHLINLESAVRITLASCRGYRLPEPTRQAHLLTNVVRRRAQA
jgi:deoxyribonuclease V